MCDIKIISNNELFRFSLEHFLKEECTYSRVKKCSATLLISDGVTLLSTIYNYSYPICSMIIFIEDEGHENLIKLTNPPFKMYFVKNKAGLSYIKATIINAHTSISTMKHCLAHINSPPNKWLTKKEFTIISDTFKGQTNANIAFKHNITFKTVQNYRKIAHNKLQIKLNYNYHSKINYFHDYIEVLSKYQLYITKKLIRSECPASVNYNTQPATFYTVTDK
ncbi:LuxR C-terminal-related transcriptional regulator [Buttiauxella noackiae]|uniref:LuxR C-terminal-related transcriptional regulator n=1 Tax=Buttiauxella noackiae TaxID=82992 RepID=UPI00235319CA|nr:LuxR C-terminal-related transcriptional regulator [Buttiauxella noackiae]MCA1922072.1 LuxR family transcriptional regulator [Buttiauxella noackiae]